ncbi:LuxR C-terminal-related transcriptional regulator [Pantoea sp. C3]|jgi:DNA-binding CsgD family transcriptional regulator|uniref:helix-turn-helix transcriptional regulator n=1 Tax=Pantoea phytostimulans TaxID=2769024 RepID=UPI0038F66FC7
MKNRASKILFYSSDRLAAVGIHHTLAALFPQWQAHEVWSFSDILTQCELRQPRMIVCIFHENMPLAGTFNVLFQLQHAFPALPVLVMTRRLIPVLRSMSCFLPTLEIMDLKVSHSALRQQLTYRINGGEERKGMRDRAEIILPDRQLRILLMMAWNCSIEHIGKELSLNYKTVSAYKLNALKKLKINTKNDLADLFMVIDELRMIVNAIKISDADKWQEVNFQKEKAC